MSVLKITQDLKQLKTRYQLACSQADAAKEEVKEAQKKETAANLLRDRLKKEIQELELNSKDPIVSEHAILRYFERVLGYDMEEIKSLILPTPMKQTITKMGSGKYPMGNGCRLVVKDNTIVTIDPA